MRKLNLLFSMMLACCLSGYAQFQLSTVPPLNGGNGSQGTTFQLTVKSTIIIDSLQQAFQNVTGQDVEIWYTSTDTVGVPDISTAGGWTLHTTVLNVNGQGTGLTPPVLQTLPANINLLLVPGTYRIYIGGSNTSVVYTTWNAANQDIFTDNFLVVKTGTNYGYGGGTPTPLNHPRQWNGAIKYSVISGNDDAAVLSVDSPTVFCAGTQSVFATIANYGSNQIDSVDVNWEVNGVAQPVFRYFQLLDTIGGMNPYTAQLNLGSAAFNAGANTVKVYTSNPNGVTDTTNFNDTMMITVNSAAAPTAISVLNTTLNTASVQAVGGAGTVEYEYGPVGFTLGTGTMGSSPSPNFTITGLSSGTSYDIYVRSNCGAGDVSSYVGPETFNTAYGVPYLEDFETFAPGITGNPYPNGWTSDGVAANPRWESEDASGANENSVGTGPLYDHTQFGTVGGIYMYMETSGGTNGVTADLISPPIHIDSALTTVEVGYWYFNFGSNIDRMEVIADTNGVETVLATYFGQQQTAQTDDWLFASHFLNGYQGKSVTLKFRGYNVACCSGDIAVDDITIDPVLPLDAGVVEVQNPVGNICPGTVTPVVGVRNFGSDTLNSVRVFWEINGALDSIDYLGTILPGDTASVSLNSTTINSNTFYDLKFYTKDPNGSADQFNLNDTLEINNLRTGISGTYTLDPSQAASASNFVDFASLTQAVSAYGVCGATVVNVAAGTYNEVIAFDTPPGMSASNTLIIDGGDSSFVFVENSLTNDRAVVSFNAASYITLKNMTIRNLSTSTVDNFGIHFTAASSYDSIVNCRVEASRTATFGVFGIGASGSITDDFAEGNNANYITIMNTAVDGGDYNVHFEGGSAGNWNIGNKFINMTLTNADDYAFYFDEQDMLEVIGCTISDLRTTSTFTGYGIASFDCMNYKMNGNNVDVPYRAIYITNANSGKQPVRSAELINNMMSTTDNSPLYLTAPFFTKVWFNSTYTSGTTQSVYFDDSFNSFKLMDSLDVRNNIFMSEGGLAFQIDIADSVFLKFNHNDYYTVSGNDLLNIDGVTYADLASYQTVQPLFNASSVELDPQYTSTNDLHILGANVNNIGDNSTGITSDIDGDPRPLNSGGTVDLGADEFDPPLCPPPFAVSVTNITADSVLLFWTGTNTNNFQYSVTLSGGVAGSGITGIVISDTSVVVNNLQPNTDYDFYVREICGRGDTSTWVQGPAFTTLCAPFTAPYFNGFENSPTDENDPCWGEIFTNYSTTANIWVRAFTGVNGPRTGTQALYIYPQTGFTQGVDTLAAVSPQFSDMPAGDKRVVFWTSVDDVAAELLIGTVPSLNPGAPVTYIDTFSYAQADVYYEVISELTTANGYNGTDQFVVLSHSLNPSSTFDYIRIDDFTYEDIPTCPKPRNLSASNATLSTIDLSWTGGTGSFEYEVVAPGGAIGSGTRGTTTTNSATATGLAQSTTYEFYVREICAVGDTSVWNGPEQFNTAYGIPFSQDFEAFPAGIFDNPYPEGWSSTGVVANPRWESEDATGNNENSVGTGPLYDHTQFGTPGGIYMYMETSGGTVGIPADFVSPPIFITPTSNTVTLEYWYFNFGANIDRMEVIVDTNGVETVVATYFGQQQTAQTDLWLKGSNALTGFAGKSVQIKFRGYNVACCSGDIAIDDVRLFEPSPSDGSVTDITSPVSGCGLGNSEPVTVEITNNGTANLTNIPVVYQLNSGTLVRDTFMGTLIPGGTTIFTFATPVDLSTPGTYDLISYTDLTVDGDSTNDSSDVVINSIPIIGGFPYSQGFENGNAGWSVNGTSSFALGAPAGAVINSASQGTQAWVTNLTGDYNNNESGWVESPCLDMSTLTAPIIEMDIWWDSEFSWDGTVLQSSIDGGATWQKVGAFGDPNNWYTDNTINALATIEPSQEGWTGTGTSGSAGWVTARHDLTGLGGVQGVLLRVVFASDGVITEEGFGFDNVRIFETVAEDASLVSIDAPTSGCLITGNDSVKVTISNAGINTLDTIPLVFNFNGNIIRDTSFTTLAPGNNIQFTFDSTINALGTNSLTVYTDVANDGNRTNDTLVSQLVSASAVAFPYSENFDLSDGGWTASGANSSWAWGAPAGTVINSASSSPNVWATNLTGDYNNNELSYLESPCIDMSGITADPVLRFEHTYVTEACCDESWVEMSLDGGTNWTKLVNSGGASGWYNDVVNQWWDGNNPAGTGNYDFIANVLTGAAGNAGVKIRFVFSSDGSVTDEGFAIDNINIDVATSITDINNDSKLGVSVYPNPSEGLFKMNIQTVKAENYNLVVRDVDGKVTFTKNISVNGSYSDNLDFTSFAKGVYYMQIQTESGSFVEKLVIQ